MTLSPFFQKVAVFVACILCIVALERIFPRNRQDLFRPGIGTDALHVFFSSFLPDFAYQALLTGFLYSASAYLGFHGLALFQDYPIWAQLIIIFLVSDFVGWVLHYAMHKFPSLWAFHQVHHSALYMDWIVAFRNHFLLEFFLTAISSAVVLGLGFSPVVFLIRFPIDILWNLFIHSNINIKLGPLNYFFNTPELHHLHHSDIKHFPEAMDVNFGTKLSIFDWIFGTGFLSKKPPTPYGVGPEFPKGYIGQQLQPFLDLKKKA